MVICDLIGDELPEIAIATNDSVFIYQNMGDFNFLLSVSLDGGISMQNLQAGDINADGLTDLILSDYNALLVYYNLGGGYFYKKSIAPRSTYSQVSDIDGDGDLDIVSNNSDTTIVWNKNTDSYSTFSGANFIVSTSMSQI